MDYIEAARKMDKGIGVRLPKHNGPGYVANWTIYNKYIWKCPIVVQFFPHTTL